MQPWHYIVLFGALVLVWTLAAPRDKGSKPNPMPEPTDKGLDHMEIALEQFMENMEQSNRSLSEMVKSTREQEAAEAKMYQQRIEELEKQCRLLQEAIDVRLAVAEAAVSEAATAANATEPATSRSPVEIEPEPASPPQHESIRMRFGRLFELQQQGRSIDQISRELGIHKGEVMLIQQLARQEEAADAT